MKKMFTLAAMLLVNVSLWAQDGQYLITEDLEIDASQDAIADENWYIWMSFGSDTYTAKASSDLPSPYTAYLSGETNPTIDSSDYPICSSGCYYEVLAYTAGTLEVGVVLNGGKYLKVVDWMTGEYVDYLAYDAEGNQVEMSADVAPASKLYGTIVFDVDLFGTYHIYAKGSKLGMAGFQFYLPEEEDDETNGITTIKSSEEETPVYNLSGRRVDASYKGIVLKNGRKMLQK